jgi:hypothetical protein
MINRSSFHIIRVYDSCEITAPVAILWLSIRLEHSISCGTVDISRIGSPAASAFLGFPHLEDEIFGSIVDKEPVIVSG